MKEENKTIVDDEVEQPEVLYSSPNGCSLKIVKRLADESLVEVSASAPGMAECQQGFDFCLARLLYSLDEPKENQQERNPLV